MIRIGDFSKLTHVSVKTLRYYDEIGLLKPVAVDGLSGYRYYEYHQLPRLYRLLALKGLGFSLEEIGRLLAGRLPPEQLRGMLKLRQAEIRQQVQAETQRLAHVERLLGQIEQENSMSPYAVVTKQIEAVKVASIRAVVPQPPDQGALWAELMNYLNQQKARMIGPPMALYHDPDFKEQDWDIEVCMPIVDEITPNDRLQVRVVPAVETMACVVHAGPFTTIGEAYDAIAKWIGANDYHIVGPCRELNLRPPQPPGNQHDPDTLNEIQFPVARAEPAAAGAA